MPLNPHRGRMLAVLLVAPFLAQADATIANVATPSIRTNLGASGAAAELVVGGYLVAFAVLVITGARLGQTHGYKRLFVLGTGVFGLASLCGGLAPDPTTLILARVVQGCGAALMFPQALSGIQLNFAGEARARAIALYSIALASGAVSGQVLGGVLVSADIAGTSWRPILLVNVPISLAVIVAGRRLLPRDSARGSGGIDVAGVATLSLALLLVVVPLTLGRSEGWPAWTWVSLLTAPLALALFLRTQRRNDAPLVNTRVMGRPPILLGLVALATATGTYYALLFTLAQFVQAGLGRSALVSGLLLVPWVAAFGAAGQVVRRRPASPLLPAAGYVLLAVAYVGIGAWRAADVPLAVLLGFGGFGLGIGFASLLGHLTNAVEPEYAPDVSGVSTTVLQIGGAIGVAAAGSLYLGLASSDGAPHAFTVTTLALAGVALLAAAAAHLATRARRVASPLVPRTAVRATAPKATP